MKNCWIRKSALVALGFSATLLGPPVAGALPKLNCTLPDGLREEIAKKYPGARLVEVNDLLDPDYKAVFKKEHGDQCPGLVRVDFYGDGKPIWALVLITKDKAKERVKFFVARKLEEGWKLRVLDTTDDTPVVWSEPAGKYESVYKTKTIRAKWPVVIVCGYGSWAVAYAWMGDRVEKVWLSD
jgi:hypothetical protein